MANSGIPNMNMLNTLDQIDTDTYNILNSGPDPVYNANYEFPGSKNGEESNIERIKRIGAGMAAGDKAIADEVINNIKEAYSPVSYIAKLAIEKGFTARAYEQPWTTNNNITNHKITGTGNYDYEVDEHCELNGVIWSRIKLYGINFTDVSTESSWWIALNGEINDTHVWELSANDYLAVTQQDDTPNPGSGDIAYDPDIDTSLGDTLNDASGMADDEWRYNELYSSFDDNYSAKSFNSIIGMPFQFMGNTDTRPGTSNFGRKYSEDILYDMPLATIIPGGPHMLSGGTLDGGTRKTALDGIAQLLALGCNIVSNPQALVTDILDGKWARYFGFSSNWTHYIQYTNTLCQLSTAFLGLDSFNRQWKDGVSYRNYRDDVEDIEVDGGKGLQVLTGVGRAVHLYYQPDSSLGQSFSNSTGQSMLADSLNNVSDMSKEFAFITGATGWSQTKGSTTGLYDTNKLSYSANGSDNLLARVFSRTGEGVGVLIGGNNLIFPEIYKDSSTSGTEYTLNVKLRSPYGDPESIFLYVLRPLWRLAALSLPRQLGPNGYTAPFLVQAFSKGMFNCQMGIVTSLVIRRGGSGGEMQTFNNLPTELEVTMTIKDLYEQITLTNQSHANAWSMMFNNIGLMDFVASYAGYNMNMPEAKLKLTYMKDMVFNRLSDYIKIDGLNPLNWSSPNFTNSVHDWYRDSVVNLGTFMAHN